MKRNTDFYLQLLHFVFVEIRALDDKDLPTARLIADIFHNLPLRLQQPLTEETSNRLWDELLLRADHYKVRAWLEACEAILTSDPSQPDNS